MSKEGCRSTFYAFVVCLMFWAILIIEIIRGMKMIDIAITIVVVILVLVGIAKIAEELVGGK